MILSSDAFAISNLDDKRGTVMLQNTPAKKYYYSLKEHCRFQRKDFRECTHRFGNDSE